MSVHIRPLIGNFRIDEVTNCWNWVGGVSPTGYSRMTYLGKQYNGSRVIAALYLGLDIADTKSHALHACDNRRCINPKHIFVGTHLDNVRDMCVKGRHYFRNQTHCKRGHEFTPENTRLANGSRHCVACQKHHSKVHSLKRRDQRTAAHA